MNKINGFTLVELLIVMAIVGIIGSIAFNAATGQQNGFLTGTSCKAGVTFSIDVNGTAQQIIGVDGRAIPC